MTSPLSSSATPAQSAAAQSVRQSTLYDDHERLCIVSPWHNIEILYTKICPFLANLTEIAALTLAITRGLPTHPMADGWRHYTVEAQDASPLCSLFNGYFDAPFDNFFGKLFREIIVAQEHPEQKWRTYLEMGVRTAAGADDKHTTVFRWLFPLFLQQTEKRSGYVYNKAAESAATAGHVSIVKRLLSQFAVHPAEVLTAAAIEGRESHMRIVQLLLDTPRYSAQLYRHLLLKGLSVAVHNRHLEMAKLLTAAPSGPLSESNDYWHSTCQRQLDETLRMSVRNADPAMCQLLLDAKYPNGLPLDGSRFSEQVLADALGTAVVQLNVEIVKLLAPETPTAPGRMLSDWAIVSSTDVGSLQGIAHQMDPRAKEIRDVLMRHQQGCQKALEAALSVA